MKSITDLRIPATVQGVLTARIDRLPPDEKALLQTLAVIGKEFSLSLLKHVVDQPEDDLLRQLARLQTSEFIYERPAFPDIEYTFKHALTQEVAYNSLLIERRKAVHERTAKAIEEVYRSKLDDRYSELAHHYSRSGNTQKAVDYLQLAGQQAVQRSANAEAINHLTSALELLKLLPDTPERIQQELALQIALGAPLQATKGWAAPEMGKVYSRARELCQQIEEAPQLFVVLWGLWQFHIVRAEYKTARELAEQLLPLAQSRQDSASLIQAHYALGLTLIFLGEFVAARECLQHGVALYDPQLHSSHTFLYGYDPKVSCLFFAAWALCYLGYPDQARSTLHQALTLAQELSHPFTTASVLGVALWVHQLLRKEQDTQEQAEILISLCNEQGFTLFLAWGTIMQGWAFAEQGQKEEGIVQMSQGLAAHQATGAEMGQTRYLALLAEAYGKMGQIEKGLSMIAEAISIVSRNGERNYEAELYRLKGELILQQFKVQGSTFNVENPQSAFPNPQLEVEECFLKAIEVAQQQQAKSLELRATMSLTRLWQQQGKQHEAHRMLSEVYNWFTEGFDTKDLQEAKSLLDALV